MYSFDLISIRATTLCVWLLLVSNSILWAETQYFQFTSNTGNSTTIVVPVEALPAVEGNPLQPGDEIGVFTPEGLCAGAVVWNDQTIDITVWGNNDQTDEIDGMVQGDSIYYRVWQESTGIEYKNIIVTYDDSETYFRTDGRYHPQAVMYVLSSLGTFPEPEAPELTSPQDNAAGIDTTITLEWTGSEMTDSFNLQVSGDADFTDMVINETGITGTSYEVSGLSYHSEYYWRVSGTNLAGDSDWSEVRRFATLDRLIQFDNPAQSTVWIENSTQTISWQVRGVEAIRIEYSIAHDAGWQLIDDSVDAGAGQYDWTVPSTPSTQARIRLTDVQHENTLAVSPVFSIYPREITVEHSLEFGSPSSVTSYRMIGLPGDNNLPMSSVMDGSAGSDWTAFYDDGSNEDYLIEYNGSNMFNFRPGRGFWILSRNGFHYQSNQNAVELNADNAYEIPLHNGWNIIANPFDVGIEWSSVQAQNDITAPIWAFNGSFSRSGSFQPYRGYYFHNEGNLETLSIPYPGGGSQSKQLPVLPETAHALKLSLTKNGIPYSDIAVYIADGYDEHIDRYTIHSPPSDFEEARIGMGNGQIHSEIRNPSDEGYIFDIRIRLPENKTYTIDIADANTFDGYDMVLVNRRSGKVIDLNGRNEFNVSTSSGVERYKLIIGNEHFTEEEIRKLIPDDITLAQNYPNPFNPATTIEYSIPPEMENVYVTLEIYNVLGQLIRTLVRDYHTSGFYSVEWDARDDHTMTVPSGVYIYRLNAGETVLSKRMLLLK